ncbi:MAG: hypothetical protein PHN90_12880 [Methanothrix sp.]|nr:hypothetical protein [Methanothrix sp.]
MLNSDRKAVRIAGYVVYVFVFFTVIGALVPSPDVDVDTSTASGAKYTDSDLDWLDGTGVDLLLIDSDINRASGSLQAGNLVVAMSAFEDLYKHAKVARDLSSNATVSRPLRDAKKEWDSALDDYKQAGSYGYTGTRDSNTRDMDRMLSYLDKGDDHLAKMKPLLEEGKADLGIS